MTRYLFQLPPGGQPALQRYVYRHSPTDPGKTVKITVGDPQPVLAAPREPVAPKPPPPATTRLWDDDIDIRRIKYATLRDNPKEAEALFDSLYKSYRQFTPIKDCIPAIEANDRIKPPENQLTKGLSRPEAVKKWLSQATFFEVYKHLFDVDMDEVLDHEKMYEVNRWLKLVLGAAEWTLGLLPFGAASAALYANAAQPLTSIMQDPLSHPVATGLIVLLGVSAFNSPTGVKDAPVLFLFKALASLLTFTDKFKKSKWSPLFNGLGGFFKRDQVNYFLARHLSKKAVALKYAKILLKHGSTGLEWEFYKDMPREYAAYKYLSGGAELVKNTLGKTGIGALKAVGDFFPTMMRYVPSTSGQLAGSLANNAWLLAWVGLVGLGTADNPADWGKFGSLALSTGALVAAASLGKARVDKIKKENPAEALVYYQLINFSVAALAILSNNVAAFRSPWGYAGALAGSTLAILGAGELLRSRQKAIANFDPPEHLKAPPSSRRSAG